MDQVAKKILILGWSGLVGSVFQCTMKDVYEIIAPTHREVDICNFSQVLQIIALHEPDVLINFAWYTDVIWAEGGGRLENFNINVLGAQNIAKAAGAFGLPLIHLSSDYVFDGEKWEAYIPNDVLHPVNNYWMAKYLSEELMKREFAETIIVRTSSLYGGSLFGNDGARTHFINSLLRKVSLEEKIRVVDDIFMSPTSVLDLSWAIKSLIENIEASESEIFHFVNQTEGKWVSWYDFTLECTQYLPELSRIQPISSSEYFSGVKRPKISSLNNTSNILLPDWKEWLKQYFLHWNVN